MSQSIVDTIRGIRNREHREIAEAAQRECAAGPWNYDMDVAPRDGTRVLLAWRHEDVVHIDVFCYGEDEQSEYVWWSGSEFLDAVEPFAWASLNVPAAGDDFTTKDTKSTKGEEGGAA